MIVILAMDVILVSAMLIGLLQMEEARQYGITRYLYRQVPGVQVRHRSDYIDWHESRACYG